MKYFGTAILIIFGLLAETWIVFVSTTKIHFLKKFQWLGKLKESSRPNEVGYDYPSQLQIIISKIKWIIVTNIDDAAGMKNSNTQVRSITLVVWETPIVNPKSFEV